MMKAHLQETSFFKVEKDRMKWISILEAKKAKSDDYEYQILCDFCIHTIKEGIHFHYDEVLDLLGLRNEAIPIDVSVEVEFIMSMFKHVTKSLLQLTPSKMELIESQFYTNFTGFDIQEFQHLSYYVFLVKTKRAVISIKNQGHNLNLKQYRQMLAKYEKYREHEFLSEDHLTEILIARQSQMNFLL